jgi:hypothetical protein
MRRIFAYFISLPFLAMGITLTVSGQDTITVPLRIRAGIDIAGPLIYAAKKNIFAAEVFASADLNEKRSVYLSAGYLDYNYSQYNYEYLNKGAYIKTGLDFNFLKPEKAGDKYWAGVGLHYGISRFSSEYPGFSQGNYWGTKVSSIARTTSWAHFLEVSPGIKTRMFSNFSMGWNISLRFLLYSGTGKDLKPIYLPGFGNAGTKVSTGVNYYLIWSIPYKKIRVIIKKEAPEETEDTQDSTTTGTKQQNQGGRP